MMDWRTDQQKSKDEPARPWLIAEAALFIAFWALGMTQSLVSLIPSLLW